jgi:hypothetical protein
MLRSGSVHVGFVLDKVALGHVFLLVFLFTPVSTIPPWPVGGCSSETWSHIIDVDNNNNYVNHISQNVFAAKSNTVSHSHPNIINIHTKASLHCNKGC